MKYLIALFFAAVASVSPAQEANPAASLKWVNVHSTYHRFEEIKPRLANKGKSSIFLSRLWPNDSAQLERFNPENGQWEPGEWGITCGTVAHADVPVEVKQNSQREIHVYWQLSTDNWEKPEHFVLFHSSQQRPLEGRYRFILRYSLEPWMLIHHPSAVYNISSPEFVLTG